MNGIVIVIQVLLESALKFSKLFSNCSHYSPEPSCSIGEAWRSSFYGMSAW